MSLTDNRIKHSYGVACLMEKLAPKLNLDSQQMFTLGWLHDIGYAFSNHAEHVMVGGVLLKKLNFPYYREVMCHGMIKSDYQSLALDLLNFCDMHIDSQGRFVSFDERLADVKLRYGENSQTYLDCCQLVAILSNKKHLQSCKGVKL